MMRQAHSVGVRELARLVGCSASHLSRVEAGERAASPELTERLLDAIADLPAPVEPT